MRFYSKKGIILFPILLLVLVVMILSAANQFINIEFISRYLGEPKGSGSWAEALVPVLAALLIIWLIMTTYYEIKGSILKISAGPITYNIDIAAIKSIRPTRNPLSNPALSLDRLEVNYGKWKKVLISPKDKERFIQELVKINPNIEVRERKS